MVQRIFIHPKYGGLSIIPRDPFEYVAERKGWKFDGYHYQLSDGHCLSVYDLPRDDPDIVAFLSRWPNEEAREKWGLVVLEIPDGVEWEIQDYDGREWVAEKHRRWEYEL